MPARRTPESFGRAVCGGSRLRLVPAFSYSVALFPIIEFLFRKTKGVDIWQRLLLWPNLLLAVTGI